MKTRHLLAAAFLSVSAVLKAHAAIVCEFQPNLDFSDCESCFKQDEYGLRLYLSGQLTASSTSPTRFPRTPIDGVIYQRGVKKEKISETNGKATLYEVCYVRATPIVAGKLNLTMTEPDLQEFDLGNPGRGAGKEYHFALAGTASYGSASFFDNTLVFMAPAGWKGESTVPFYVVDENGVSSVPGLITISAMTPIPMAAPEIIEPRISQDEIELAAQMIINDELMDEIASVEALLKEAKFEGDAASDQIVTIEIVLHEAYERMNQMDLRIAELNDFKLRRDAVHRLFASLSAKPELPSQLNTIRLNPVGKPLSEYRQVDHRSPSPIPLPPKDPRFVVAEQNCSRLRRFIAIEPEAETPRSPMKFVGVRPGRRQTKKEKKLSKKERKFVL
jgi:hypothetical protein